MPKILPSGSRKAVSELLGTGLSDYEITRQTGVGRATVQRWRRRGIPWTEGGSKHMPADWTPPDPVRYSYLLGMYLGDGTITRHGSAGRHRFALHLYLDRSYPDVIEQCADSMSSVLGSAIGRYPRKGSECLQLTSYSRFWPEVFPQHGSGNKHERKIELEGWQREIAERYPEKFIRGLIHSDGS